MHQRPVVLGYKDVVPGTGRPVRVNCRLPPSRHTRSCDAIDALEQAVLGQEVVKARTQVWVFDATCHARSLPTGACDHAPIAALPAAFDVPSSRSRASGSSLLPQRRRRPEPLGRAASCVLPVVRKNAARMCLASVIHWSHRRWWHYRVPLAGRYFSTRTLAASARSPRYVRRAWPASIPLMRRATLPAMSADKQSTAARLPAWGDHVVRALGVGLLPGPARRCEPVQVLAMSWSTPYG